MAETYGRVDGRLRKILEDLKAALEKEDLKEASRLVTEAMAVVGRGYYAPPYPYPRKPATYGYGHYPFKPEYGYPGAKQFLTELEHLELALEEKDNDRIWASFYILEGLGQPKAGMSLLETIREAIKAVDEENWDRVLELLKACQGYGYPAPEAYAQAGYPVPKAAESDEIRELIERALKLAESKNKGLTKAALNQLLEKLEASYSSAKPAPEGKALDHDIAEALKQAKKSEFARVLEILEGVLKGEFEDAKLKRLLVQAQKQAKSEEKDKLISALEEAAGLLEEGEYPESKELQRETLFHLQFKEIASSEEENVLYVEGYASTGVTDRTGDRIFPDAFKRGLKAFMKNPVLLLHHDLRKPIGKILEAKINETGLWVRAAVDKSLEWGAKAADMIQKGILNAFSVRAVDDLADGWVDARGVRNITNWDLREVSVVTVPAHQQALFSIAKALELGSDLVEKDPVTVTVGGKRMAEEITIEELTQKIKEQLETEAKAAEEAHQAEEAKIKEIREQAVKDYQEELKKKAKEGKLPFEFPTEPASRPIFVASKFDRVPTGDLAVDYLVLKAMGRTPSIEMFRTLMERAGTLQKSGSIDWTMVAPSPEDVGAYQVGYKQLLEIAPKVDELVYSTQTGYGDEWVPTLAAAELWREIRLEAKVIGLFDQFDMPSQPYDYPAESTDPTFYKVGETTGEAMLAFGSSHPVPDSKIATSKVTFSAGKLGARTHWSEEMDEDSIIAVQPQFRDQFGIKLAHVLDEVIVSGDETSGTSTLNISYRGGAAGTTRVVLTIDGLRHEPLVTTTTDSFNAGTLTIDDFVTARSLMGTAGKYAVDPAQLVYICDPGVWFKAVALDDVLTMDTIGAQATILTGQLGSVMGIPLVVSEDFGLTDTSGYIHSNSANNTKGSLLCVNRRGWRIGWRQRPRIFVKAYPEYASYMVMALSRFDLQPLKAGMCACGYNVTV